MDNPFESSTTNSRKDYEIRKGEGHELVRAESRRSAEAGPLDRLR